jgi:phthiodiolone/phenolphthiodiolone dimycocerosates ketoreductase
MLDLTGRYADGWYPAGVHSPEEFAAKLKVIHEAAERAGRDPDAIVTTYSAPSMISEDDAELAEMLEAPLIKSYILQLPATMVRDRGFVHPMGENWRGVHDLDPRLLTREVIIDLMERVTPELLLAVVPHGTPRQVAEFYKQYVDAGAMVPKIMDYGSMAGTKFAAGSADKVKRAEDELLKLIGVPV